MKIIFKIIMTPMKILNATESIIAPSFVNPDSRMYPNSSEWKISNRENIFFSGRVGRAYMPHFLSQTLQKASSIQQAVYGSFSSPKAQEIVVSRYASYLRVPNLP